MSSMSQPFLESLAVRTKCLTLSRGRLLLDLDGGLHFDPQNDENELQERAEMFVSRGVAFARLGLWTEAIGRWRKAIELNPQSSDARNNLAVAYELQGNLELATAEYERALAVETANVYIEQNFQLLQQAMTVKKRKEENYKTF